MGMIADKVLIADIMRGSYDSSLEAILHAVVGRRKLVEANESAVKRATLGVGDRVKLASIRPAYMEGRTGTIIELPTGNSKRFRVQLDEVAPRFGATVKVTADMIEEV